jgi:hypothetical protein
MKILPKNKIFVISLLFFLFSLTGFSQFTETGQDPSFIKWRQINTSQFTLVYDSAFENQAQKIAAIFDYTSTLTGNSLHQPAKKIPILIRNHSVISNGMVVWAPKRMELYTVPPQDLYAQPWFEQLAIHEGRHVAQINRLNVKDVKMLSTVYGDWTLALPSAQTTSLFFEGDAVTTETALSKAGRGRLPSFEMAYRAFLLENNKPYNFRKAVFGSFKDNVPNHYELGYIIVAYNRAKYGPMLWENVLDNIGSNFFHPTPFLSSLKKQLKTNRRNLYKNTLHELDSIWRIKSAEISYTEKTNIIKINNSHYTSQRSSCLFQGNLIALKTGTDEVLQIVKINVNSGTETILATPGIIASERIQICGNEVYWDEYIPDLRWEQRSYTIIRKLNIQTLKSTNIGKKNRYFAPSPSPNGKYLAVIETNVKGNNSLVLLNAQTGNIEAAYPSPNNNAIQLPSWDASSRYIVMTQVGSEGKSLVTFDCKNEQWETILAPSAQNISQPVYNGNFIYFNASYSGIDNIYAFDIKSKQVFQVTSSKFGAFDPIISENNDTLFYSDYTSHGFVPVFSMLDSSKWISLQNTKNISITLANKISEQEPVKFDVSQIATTTYESKPYSKTAHLIKIHSWIPLYFHTNGFNATDGVVMPGYLLLSQNLLNTVSFTAGQGYFNKKLYSGLNISYKALYPAFEASVLYGGAIDTFANKNLYQLQLRSYLPLNLSRGNIFSSITPQLSYLYINDFYKSPDMQYLRQGVSNYVVGTSFQIYKQYNQKSSIPHLGIGLNGYYIAPIFGSESFNSQYVIKSSVYLPSIFKHHSFKFSFAYEDQSEPKLYISPNRLTFPRGFTDSWSNNNHAIKNMRVYSADYVFPLIFPDLTVFRILYLKRINTSIFGEQAIANEYVEKTLVQNSYKSAGVELSFDFHAFFIPGMFTISVRESYLPANKKYITEFYFGSSLTNF